MDTGGPIMCRIINHSRSAVAGQHETREPCWGKEGIIQKLVGVFGKEGGVTFLGAKRKVVPDANLPTHKRPRFDGTKGRKYRKTQRTAADSAGDSTKRSKKERGVTAEIVGPMRAAQG